MIRKFAGAGFVLLLLAGAGTVGTLRAQPVEVNIGFFYDSLAPYGEWITVDPYGEVWCPYDTPTGWRPYTDGDWLYSDCGWTFYSPVEWGWACYHYGRWGFSDLYGWFWVPGTVWGPAWVAWRYGGGYIGWAPLPPDVGWSFGMGLEWDGFDLDVGIGWPWWSFCQVFRFGEAHLSRDILSSGHNVVLMRNTRNVTSYRTVGGRVFNENIGITDLERETGRKFARYTIADSPAAGRAHVPQIRGTAIEVFRPRVLAGRSAEKPRNILPPSRTSVSQQEMEKRHQQESGQLSQRHRADQEALSSMHKNETPLPGASKDELERRHQAEMKALEERHQREAQALENRHKREQEQRQAAQNERQQSTGSKPVKKK
jgi:hypothetical protein